MFFVNFKNNCNYNWDGKNTHAHACAYRVIDSPHQDAQHRVTGAENLHVLLHKVFLFRLSLGRQSAQSGGDVGRRHGALGPVCAALCAGFGRPLMWSSQEWAAELRPMFTPPALDAQQQVQGNFLLCVLVHLLTLPVYILIHISLIRTLLVVLAAHMLNHPKPACFKLI